MHRPFDLQPSPILALSDEVWIDVGGTFTDCFVRRADGKLLRCKVLSSGRFPVPGDVFANGRNFHANGLTDPQGFWSGAKLLRINPLGHVDRAWRVVDSSIGRLQLAHDAEPDCSHDVLPPTHEAVPEELQSVRKYRWELETGIEAPVLGVHRLLGIPLSQRLPELRVRLGTTKGTNALLTRRGASVALAITAPFVDLLRIGDQTRPKLFELAIQKPAPLAAMTIGIPERLAADGSVLRPLDDQQTLAELRRVRDAGCTSLAICLMHSYVKSEHEERLQELAEQVGFEHISCSSKLAPVIEIVARAQTTVVDAYLSPVIQSYLRDLFQQFGLKQSLSFNSLQRQPADRSSDPSADEGSLHVMTSAGGLIDWRSFSGKDSILSGPAGGVSALAAIREATGFNELIGLDMGGTSTDVCRVSGDHELQYESTKAGVRILTPTLPIETVAAGGGSVCWFDGVSLRVGPQSAGASPGPACYGRGGPLTITDLNVILDRIPAGQFPFEMDRTAIENRLDELLVEASSTLGICSRKQLAGGFRRLANEQMAEAVRTVTIAQGADPRTHVLAGFGGAAGQHICEIADLLEIDRIVDSAEAGLLSALGVGLARLRADAALAIYQTLDELVWPELTEQLDRHEFQLRQELYRQGVAEDQICVTRLLELRYAGTGTALTVRQVPPECIAQRFHDAHHLRFGYSREEREIELVTFRLECQDSRGHWLSSAVRRTERQKRQSQARVARHSLQPGDVFYGPTIVENEGSTLVVENDWAAECLSDGTLLLTRNTRSVESQTQLVESAGIAGNSAIVASTTALEKNLEREFDPVFRDCFAARLSAIATQMGFVLQQSAVSVNVKQRRDYSCAVFDAEGRLLSSAPHVPVHLGAMGDTVRSIIAEFPESLPGDSFITNDPYRGGSHLPDITVITPVFDEAGLHVMMYVGNRAHHADVGGISPGSMSVQATCLGDEGVVIPPMKLTERWHDRLESLVNLLQQAKYPPRNVTENLADIAAQQAANLRGIELLQKYAGAETWSKLKAYAGHLLTAAETRIKGFIQTNFQGRHHFTDHLDDGTVIRVSIAFPGNGMMNVDFQGSGPTNPRNFNANPSIVKAAIMYVLRCLIADEIPLNEGVLRAVDLVIPTGILSPTSSASPEKNPAVAAGNVETSQRVVDVLLGALQVAAASQGTMNNLLFGNDRFGFYETICGGAGATAKSSGADAVHTHMTNTRLTDPEVLEFNYPVRLVNFAIRRGSGGSGAHSGGCGVVREIEFLEPVTVSLLTSRRGVYPPFGLQGGQPGRIGENTLSRHASRQKLDGCCQFSAFTGDRLEIQTPGGGGFGAVG